MNDKLKAAKLVGGASDRDRADKDYYATPFFATEAILNALEKSGETLSGESILEPSAGGRTYC